jgi:hypothetical protein
VGSSLSLSLDEDKKNIHSLCRELFENHFRDVFGDEYYWTAKDAGNMSSLLGKIKFRREKKGMPNETGDMLDALKSLLLSIKDGWLFENFSVSNINSKFNEILSKAKEQRDGTNQKSKLKLYTGKEFVKAQMSGIHPSEFESREVNGVKFWVLKEDLIKESLSK